ncbi:hypothetical protein D9619_005541 [Psilocybe cf. subviscida]|uniref:Uncharacterized protein n=1 Tax=Psilocybe cf. subviscida TaxID=2480587 RepID=A0A8H5FBT3_9AGAR|nr:hypothetical protein D9619_005541 [Psilocybe cf. subviscida]
MATIDLIPLERDLFARREATDDEAWAEIENTARELANHLRVRNGPVDNHTLLGATALPQTLAAILAAGAPQSCTPNDDRTAPINEILRVGANLCMDHNDNRGALLEVGFPQAVISILEAYAESIPSPPTGKPLPLSIPHLKVVRTSIGVLLNASIGFDMAKARLTSYEAALTIIKLSANIYPPTAWASAEPPASEEVFAEEWALRWGISNWAWRTVSALKDGQDESLQVINSEVLPWITAPLLQFCPPQSEVTSSLLATDPDLLDDLLQTDFEFLEEACTLFESLSLDVEDIRLELARAKCYPPANPISCLEGLVNFIEYGTYPALWKTAVFDDAELKKKTKAFDICKAALIKSVVEVFGEGKNEDLLWLSNTERPGGPLISRLVGWIAGYVKAKEEGKDEDLHRADMAICASLSLGNLARKAPIAAALLSPPYSLAPVLASPHFLSSATDLNLKHGILGLLKHLSQFSKVSTVIPESLYALGASNEESDGGVLEHIAKSGIWDGRSDAMAEVIQLNAIGVAKHMCHASLNHTFALVLGKDSTSTSGLTQILDLIKRTDSVAIKSEGSRVLVNVVRTVWFSERSNSSIDPSADERHQNLRLETEQKERKERREKKEKCLELLLTKEYVQAITAFIARSNKYPLLVNEGIVAISLLATHRLGGPLVLEALTVSANVSPVAKLQESSDISNGDEDKPTTDAPTDTPLPAPTSAPITLSSVPSEPELAPDGLPIPRHALDLLLFVVRNFDNPVNFPVEVRTNACTFFLQLPRHAPPADLEAIRARVVDVIRRVVEDEEGDAASEKLVKAARMLVDAWTKLAPPSATVAVVAPMEDVKMA